MKGIVLAGGTGSRLWPSTKVTSKQLLPVYDKPMIYYPISTLMLAGIREILIISTPGDLPNFMKLLGDGSLFGVKFQYAEQPKPEGLAQAYMIGKDFLGNSSSLMILGDNIFHGTGLGRDLSSNLPIDGAHVFTYEVSNPEDYGILELDSSLNPLSITEKPKQFISNLAVTGLYFFDSDVIETAHGISPSARGELEITSLIDSYLQKGRLSFTKLSRGTAWLDTGSANSLHDAASYVRIIEERTGLKIACLEEIAWNNGWIDDSVFYSHIQTNKGNSYGRYLEKIRLAHDFSS